MFDYLLLILGFIFLIKGASLLVDGAVSLAKHWRVSHLVIGLTVVSFGAAAPELALNLTANIRQASDLAFGNIIGANIANILLVLGLVAAISPLAIKPNTVWKEVHVSIIAAFILLILANNLIFSSGHLPQLSRLDGLFLILLFGAFMYYVFGRAQKISGPEEKDYRQYPLGLTFAHLVIGATGLIIGAGWVIEGAKTLIIDFQLSEAFVGLALLTLGSTLPELIISLTAIAKKNAALAIGNIIGSNIFNLLFILGISALIRPLAYNQIFNADLFIMIMAGMIFYYLVLVGKKGWRLERSEGLVLIGAYVVYLIFLVWRG